MGRLIIISNRLPFSLFFDEGKPRVRQSSGGLVSALKSYFERSRSSGDFKQKIWVGTGDFSENDWNKYRELLGREDFAIEPVFIEDATYNNYYNGFANSTLWPLFHYFPSITEYRKEYFEAYVEVNRIFSQKVASILQPGDVVWVHDYQLMMLPQMLRRLVPSATIGFFLHIPFPSYEIFRLMPLDWKNSLLVGVLGADLIGFHTFDYAQHFIHTAKMSVGVDNRYNTLQYDNRSIKVDLFPIGIDVEKFSQAIREKEVQKIVHQLRQTTGNKKIIFSVDRLDYTKGINYRLEAYEQFLEEHPEWSEKVIFILNVIPSRDAIPAYIDRKKMIEEKVSTINGKYSTLSWQPLIYRYNHVTFQELVALYNIADIALITPLRDGMNLVAKEYVASCRDTGVLILSELTGAASELSEAIQINPTDTEQMSGAITAALTMKPDEQKLRLKKMKERLVNYDVVAWVNDFLQQLEMIKQEQLGQQAKVLDEKAFDKILKHYQGSTRRCILLDYDGTLAPFTETPHEAMPNKELLNVLKDLSSDEKNEVVIISGRDSKTLEKWLGHLPLNFVSEHGVFIKYRGGNWETQTDISPAWKDQVRPLLQSYVRRCAGSLMEEKDYSLSWHYRKTHPGLGFIRSRELLNNLSQLTANSSIQVIDGNKVLEIRLTGLNKGATAQKILDKLKSDFVLCLGDDTTDEDMFKALENKAYTVRIGCVATSANFNLSTQDEVLPFLQRLMQQPVRKKRKLFANFF